MKRLLTSAALLGLLALGVLVARRSRQDASATTATIPAPAPAGAVGTLTVSHFGSGPAGAPGARHRTVFVNGNGFHGMEDNDLRGFLDGTFKWGWNQVSQSHVRIGRRENGAVYGEHELFRVLQRWSQVRLPPHSRVLEAQLVLTVEGGPDFPLRVMLYPVRKDWNPGGGGVLENNNSPPKAGEVWWNDVAFGAEPWALPGAGFASDTDSEADTGEMPLAEAVYRPGTAKLAFSSRELAAHADVRTRAGAPLLFLLKIDDFQEDIPGAKLDVYSANEGIDQNPARRPRLTLVWQSAAERAADERSMRLEHGRSYLLPVRDALGASWHAVSFDAAPGSLEPTLEVRGRKDGAVSPWLSAAVPVRRDWDSVEVRVSAATYPLALGDTFAPVFRDTWVRTAPPEEQVVQWTFVSPTGVKHEVRSAYIGDSRWRSSFVPDELGPWTYRWRQNFTEKGYRSAPGTFTVVARDRGAVRDRLANLVARLSAPNVATDSLQRHRAMIELSRLERAAVRLEGPRAARAGRVTELRQLLKRARAALGDPVPDSIPLEADAGPEWARETARQ